MATIEVEIEINAPVDKVWDIVSNIDDEPRFWKGTKEVKNISKEANSLIRIHLITQIHDYWHYLINICKHT